MDSLWIRAYACVAVFVVVQMGLFILHSWEHRRFARSRRSKLPDDVRLPRTTLVAPCKGLDLGLEDNLRPLFEQDHGNYSLRLVVESEADPAAETIRQLIDERPGCDAELIVAGVSSDSGQKVHNLLAATAHLPSDVEVVAFVDSDARPRPEWLRCLSARLDKGGIGAITGYRWFVPTRPGAANYLLYSINCVVAMLMGPGGHHLVWGGSWAIRRDTLERLRLRDAWRGTLSDDLVATRVLQAANLPIEFEPNCMVASPIDMDWDGMFEFIRRQFIIGRCYLPWWWLGALAVTTCATIAFWGGLWLLLVGVMTQARWSWIPAVTVSLLYNGHVVRGWLRQDVGRCYAPESQAQLRMAQWVDVWLAPVGGLVCWLAMASSIVGFRITWRGIRYWLRPGGRIFRVQRLGGGPAAEPVRETRRPHFARRQRTVERELRDEIEEDAVASKTASHPLHPDTLLEGEGARVGRTSSRRER